MCPVRTGPPKQVPPPQNRLERAWRGGKISRIGASRDVGVTARVHGDAGASVKVVAAQVGGVNEGRAGGIQLGHKGVGEAAAESRLERAWGGGKITRLGASLEVGAAVGAQGNAEAPVKEAAAKLVE